MHKSTFQQNVENVFLWCSQEDAAAPVEEEHSPPEDSEDPAPAPAPTPAQTEGVSLSVGQGNDVTASCFRTERSAAGEQHSPALLHKS